jgi:glucose dehydrogenase
MADYNVVIIGSGVAGALCAAGLAGDGRKILVLEAGKNGLGVAQREQFHRVWDPVPGKSWNTPYLKQAGMPFYPSPPGTDTKTYFDQPDVKDPKADSLKTFKAYYQRMEGGTTWAWRGNTPRMLPNDFQLKSLYFPDGAPDRANVVDWPITYKELAPWYLQAERELGVSGNRDEWDSLAPRYGEDFPMPGQPKSYSDQVFIARLMKNPTTITLEGESLTPTIITMAQARNTRPYDGRPACEGNNNCIPLCPTSAKYDATVHLKRAYQQGVEIRNGCVVTRLEAADNGLISRVFYKQWDSDNPQLQRPVTGDIVILAANPIETPKILFLSGLYDENDPFVGRHLMDHVQGECLALAGEPIYPFRGPQSICGIDSLRDGQYRKRFASFRLTLGNDGWGRAGNPTSVLEMMLNPTDLPQFATGDTLRKNLVDRLTQLIRFGFSTEQLPHPDNRVTLSDKTDALGIPRPKIRYEVHPYTLDALQKGYEVSQKLFQAMGAKLAPESSGPTFDVANWNTAGHIMGTCRMGTGKHDSVVDVNGRCHNHANLFIVGSSVFPTGSVSNPTITLAALALMTVHAVQQRLAGK